MDWFLFDNALHQERVNKLIHPKHYMRKTEAVTSLQLYWKRDFKAGVFLWILQNFKKIFFTEHLRMINFEKIMT